MSGLVRSKAALLGVAAVALAGAVGLLALSSHSASAPSTPRPAA